MQSDGECRRESCSHCRGGVVCCSVVLDDLDLLFFLLLKFWR